MLLIGGLDSTAALNDVWELSLRGRLRWRRFAVLGTPPAGRLFHTATLDPEHDRILIFGGVRGRVALEDNELWELRLADRPRWKQLAAVGGPPGPRAAHSAAYAPDLHGIIVFGGSCTFCGDYACEQCWSINDTWLLSTEGEPTWSELTHRISGEPPCGLQGHSAVYDPSTRSMTVFGGWEFLTRGPVCGGPRFETWTLSLQDMRWSASPSGSNEPLRRGHAVAALDAAAHRALLYGGESDLFGHGSAMSDCWGLELGDSMTWSAVFPSPDVPLLSRESGQCAAYDPTRDRLLIYQDDRLWAYPFHGHLAWARLTPNGIAPPPRTGHVVVYDSKRDRLVVFGGADRYFDNYLSDTWTVSLCGDLTWAQMHTAGLAPALANAAGLYDPEEDRLVIFGGEPGHVNGVWTLSLGADPEWRQLIPSRQPTGGDYDSLPLARLDASIVYDPRRDQMVLFGGGLPDADSWSGLNDTWSLPLSGPAVWHRLTPPIRSAAAPASRALHVAIDDPIGDRMIVVGGFLPGAFKKGPFRDVWSLDLRQSAWTKLEPEGGPVPTWNAPLGIYDPRRARIVVGEGGYLWALDLRAEDSGRSSAGAPVAPTRLLDSPVNGPLALHLSAGSPNPSAGGLQAVIWLPDASPASLELLDLGGRRVWGQSIGALGPGSHLLAVSPQRRLTPGVYFLRLTHGPTSVTKKIVRIE
jgi:hypothetical protein